MILNYVIMLIVTIAKGSKYSKSLFGIERYNLTLINNSCSYVYWILYIIYIPIALLMTYKISLNITEEYNYRLSIGYLFNKQDVVWSDEIFWKYPMFALISGLMAGLLGIGGGLIIGPLLLDLGLHPIISTATSNFMVLFTASSTSIQFIILVRLITYY